MATSVREQFVNDDYVDCVVSYVEGPRKFYVQPLSCGNDLRSLTKRLHILFNTNVLGETDLAMTLDHLAMSMRSEPICWCAAPFQIDGAMEDGQPLPTYYYRATVLQRAGPSTVKVFYVDYGNTGIVPIANLKMLPNTFQDMPVMAVPCRLVEGEADGNNLIDVGSFRTVVDGFHVVVHVSPANQVTEDYRAPHIVEPLWVSLFVTDGKDEANVGETLLTDLQAQVNSR